MYLRFPRNKATLTKPAPDKHVLNEDNRRAQRGIVMPLAAVSLLALLGFAALAIDVGHLFVVRNELQNAADSAALAGAGYLYRNPAAIPDCTTAETQASNAVSLNKADNTLLVTGTVQSGYWDINYNPAVPWQTTCSSVTPPVPPYFAGVMVTISKSGGNGAVNAFFAQVLGITTFNPSAKAVAVVTGPGQGNLFPIVLSDCLFNNYWDSTTNSPKLATSTSPLPGQTLPQTVGQPYVFEIESSYHAGVCASGQWTAFNLSPANVSTISDLIDRTITYSGTLNDSINTNLASGSKTALYTDVANCSSGGGTPSCSYVLVPVVADSAIRSGGFTPITSLACIHIITAVGGSGKYVEAQMVAPGNPNCIFPNTGGIGPINYGALRPPSLVNYWGNNL